jgi:aspartyl/asparaginyl-tRNA synthetase
MLLQAAPYLQHEFINLDFRRHKHMQQSNFASSLHATIRLSPLQHCPEDLAFFDSMVEKGLLARLQDVLDKPFATVTYSEAIKLLLAAKKDFEYPVAWGIDLQSEHER